MLGWCVPYDACLHGWKPYHIHFVLSTKHSCHDVSWCGVLNNRGNVCDMHTIYYIGILEHKFQPNETI